MKNLKISIVIPAKNCEKTIAETINSISAQTYNPFEVIVVNDGSADKTIDVLRQFERKSIPRFKVISLEKSGGASKARNIGAAQAKGQLLAFVDSDIVLFKNALEEGINFKEKNPELGGFFGLFTPQLRFKNLLSQYKHLYLCYLYSKQGDKRSTLDTSLSFIDRKLFSKYKFNENLKCISEDAEIAMRMIKDGYTIKQASNVNMEHIKRYTLKSFIRSEYLRGKLFSRLLLKAMFKDKKESGVNTFYLKPIYIYLNVALMPFLLLSLILLGLFQHPIFFYTVLFVFLILILLNFGFWRYLQKRNGTFFVCKAILITFFDMIIMDIGIGVTVLNFLIKGSSILNSK